MRGATFDIYSARLRVESDDGPALRILMRLLDGFPAASAPGRAPREACLTLRFVPRPAAPPEGAAPLFHHGGVRLLREGRSLWLADDWSRLRVDVAAGCAEGDVHPGSWTHEQAFEERFLRLGLQALLRGQGLFPLCAAAVLAGDAVALVAGLPGEGAASLAEAWARNGGASLNASALVWSDGQGTCAGAWPELPAPAPGSAASPSLFVDQPWSPAAAPHEPGPAGSAQAPSGQCRPEVLLFLLPSSGHTRLEPLLTREALAALVPASPLLLAQPELAAAHLETLRALARQCRCYRLFLALDPRRRPQSLSRLLPAIATPYRGIATQP